MKTLAVWRSAVTVLVVLAVLLPGAAAQGPAGTLSTEATAPLPPEATVWYSTTLDSGGNVGEYASLVLMGPYHAYDAHAQILYYDRTNGDLKFTWRDVWNDWTWETVVVDSSGDVGQYAALCTGDSDTGVYAVYYDATNGDLKVARGQYGLWLDFWTPDSGGDVGRWTACAVEGSTLVGGLHASYYDVTNGNLKYARYDTGTSTWTVTTLDSTGDVGQYTAMASTHYGDRRAISYYDATNSALKYIEYGGGAWGPPQTLDSTGNVGPYSSFRYFDTSAVEITYWDATNGDLKLAANYGSGWAITTLDSANNVGAYNAADLGNSYYDATNGNLRYRSPAGSFANVDTGGDVGQWTSLGLTKAPVQRAHISYYDVTNGNLKYAYQCDTPTASFAHSPEPACVNTAVGFNNTSTGSKPLAWAWTFGDGGTSTLPSPSHGYASQGQYTAHLEATNECGTAGLNQTVTVYDRPVPDFTFAPQPGCAGAPVQFVDTSSYSGTATYLWNFGDGVTSTLQNPSHIYSDPGTYNVTLRVTNLCGHRETTKQALVDTAPEASFTRTPDPLCVGGTVRFTNTTQVSGTTLYLWDFGDGGTSNQVHPQHTYTAAGAYSVTLAALHHCGNDATQMDLLVHGPPANTTFSWEPAPALPLDPVLFTAATSSTLPVTFGWDFGDGGSGNGPTIYHVYAAAGPYPVTLTATTGCGTASAQRTVEVCDPAWQAGFSWQPALPVQSEIVTFTGAITGGSAPFTYTWDFGDGGAGAGAVVGHAYGGGGSYSVTLTTTNHCGLTATAAPVFVCAPAGLTDLSWFPPTPTLGGVTQFTAAVAGQPFPACAWDFGDGTTAGPGGCAITHTYATTGTFTVAVTATNDCGSAGLTRPLVVVAAPVAAFTSSAPGCLGATTYFTNTTSGAEPLAFRWSFGDGYTTTLRDPTHDYAAAGEFTVALTASNPHGASAATATVQIGAGVTSAGFTWEPASPAPGQAITFTAQANGTAPVTYAWSWGDGLTATGRVVAHAYATTAVYTVTLQAANACGGQIVAHPVAVSFCTAPTGLQVAHCPLHPIQGEVVYFTATLAAGSAPLTWAWDFGDGSPWAYGAAVTHTYRTGSYTVSAAAWNPCGYAGPVNVTLPVGGRIYLPVVFRGYCADAYEPDDTAPQARALVLGVTQRHNFVPEGDEDWTRVELVAGRRYRFWTSDLAGSADTRLYLYRQGQYGNPVAQNDDWAAGNCDGTPADPKQSCLVYTPAATGVYELKTNQYTGGAVWDCQVQYTLAAAQQ